MNWEELFKPQIVVITEKMKDRCAKILLKSLNDPNDHRSQDYKINHVLEGIGSEEAIVQKNLGFILNPREFDKTDRLSYAYDISFFYLDFDRRKFGVFERNTDIAKKLVGCLASWTPDNQLLITVAFVAYSEQFFRIARPTKHQKTYGPHNFFVNHHDADPYNFCLNPHIFGGTINSLFEKSIHGRNS